MDVVAFDPYDAASFKADVSGLQTTADAIQAKTDQIGSLTVTWQSATAANGHLSIFAGDDYLAADGRALTVTIEDYAGPDLAEADCKLRLTPAAIYEVGPGPTLAEVEATATIAINGDVVTLTADLPAADSLAMGTYPPATAAHNYTFQFVATVGGNIVTLATGHCTVHQKIDPKA